MLGLASQLRRSHAPSAPAHARDEAATASAAGGRASERPRWLAGDSIVRGQSTKLYGFVLPLEHLPGRQAPEPPSPSPHVESPPRVASPSHIASPSRVASPPAVVAPEHGSDEWVVIERPATPRAPR